MSESIDVRKLTQAQIEAGVVVEQTLTIGGMGVGALLAAVGGRDVGSQFGGILVMPSCASALGLLGGGVGGWRSWLIRNGQAEPVDPGR